MSQISKLEFLESIFGKCRYHANTHEAEFFSPFCSHHKPKLSVNLLTDKWKCWISGKSGKRLLFPMKEAGASREQIKKYLELFRPSETEISQNRYIGNITDISWPESYCALVNCKDSMMGKKAWDYLLGRGLSELDFLRYKIGICSSGEFEERIIFPSFNAKGNLNFYTGRRFDGHYQNPIVPKGYTNSIILNEINIDWDKPVVLTEGFIDLYKSVLNTVPLFKSTLIDDSFLFETIVEKSVEAILALDLDAWKKQDDIAKLLSSYGVPVSQMNISKKDLGDHSKEQGLELYETRIPWTPKNAFLRRLRNL